MCARVTGVRCSSCLTQNGASTPFLMRWSLYAAPCGSGISEQATRMCPYALPMTGAIRCEDKCWCQFLPSARAWRRGAGPLPHMTMATDAVTTTDIIPIIPAADRRHRKPMTGTTTVIGICITRPVHPSTCTMRAAISYSYVRRPRRYHRSDYLTHHYRHRHYYRSDYGYRRWHRHDYDD